MPHSETGKYPFYIVPDVERYSQLDPSCDEAKKIAGRIAVNIGDQETLKRILGEMTQAGELETQDSPESSFDTITAFLDKFASDIKPAGYIPEEPSEEPETPAEKINSQDKITLASLIKTHRYKEALAFIEHQNLNNPQKSIYFAHQMRFIKKLIALDNYRNKNQG